MLRFFRLSAFGALLHCASGGAFAEPARLMTKDEIMKMIQSRGSAAPKEEVPAAPPLLKDVRRDYDRKPVLMSEEQWKQFHGVIRARLASCRMRPYSATRYNYVPQIKVELERDGTVLSKSLENPPLDAEERAYSDSLMAVINRCAVFPIPDRFLTYYSQWRVIRILADPEPLRMPRFEPPWIPRR